MKIRKSLPLLVFLAIVLAFFGVYRVWKQSVTDLKPPKITVEPGVFEISVHDPYEKMLEGIVATDDFDGDVTGSLMIEKIGVINEANEFVVTYAAFDSSCNVAKVRRTLRYVDYESPKFYLSSPLLYAYGRDVDIVNRVTATDLIDGNISHRIKPTITSEIPLSSEGVHNIMFRVTNSLGDTTELNIPAEVYPSGKYNAKLSLSDYLIYIPVGQSFNERQYLRGFEYDDVSVRLGNTLPQDYRLVTSGQVNTDIPGVYPVSYTLTRTVDKYIYTGYSKLIVIVEG